MSNRPNILLITTDQHRGDHLSIAGHPIVETPNLDSFINHGAYFPNAYFGEYNGSYPKNEKKMRLKFRFVQSR